MTKFPLPLLPAVALLLVFLPQPAYTESEIQITSACVSSGGEPANDNCSAPWLSGDARFIAFHSRASNLVDGGLRGAFVHDRLTGETEYVSPSLNGGEPNGVIGRPAISANGRFVVYASNSSQLVNEPGNSFNQIYLFDRETRKTIRISNASDGSPGNGSSSDPVISADGSLIAYGSLASNLVPGDTNASSDIFVFNRALHITRRASVSSAGQQGNDSSLRPRISSDGKYVTFFSQADNLIPDDNNGVGDIFRHSLITGETIRVSVTDGGGEAEMGAGANHAVSANGRFVVFESWSEDIVSDDTNNTSDIFLLYDHETGEVRRISIDTDGNELTGRSHWPSVSDDGRYVVFASQIPHPLGLPQLYFAVFVHSVVLEKTEIVSRTADGTLANGSSIEPTISNDGRFIAFRTAATNLVDNPAQRSQIAVVNNILYGTLLSETEVRDRIQQACPGYENFDCLAADFLCVRSTLANLIELGQIDYRMYDLILSECLGLACDSEVEQSVAEAYQSGFESGVLSVDKDLIREDGYQSGYEEGYSDGFEDGLAAGGEEVKCPVEGNDGIDLEQAREMIQSECPCEAAANHGQYVSCVNRTLNGLTADSLISEDMRRNLAAEASQSSCGKETKPTAGRRN